MLAKEATAPLKLRNEWDVTVPPLLAAGCDSSGQASVLATRYVPCARFLKPIDQHLRPQLEHALAAAHAHYLAHGDLRPSIVLVEEGSTGQECIWLIGWGLAVLSVTYD